MSTARDHAPTILTARLRLLPVTAPMARAAHDDDRARLDELVGARVPDEWPADIAPVLPIHARLVELDPSALVWGPWLAVDSHAGQVVGDLGFKGAPGADGCVEIGYSTITTMRGRGFATEATRAIIDWAFACPDIVAITAESERDNVASARVLDKAGLRRSGARGTLDLWRRERTWSSPDQRA